MLIICPKCFAQYEVDETKFNKETQVFQCSRCGKRFEEKVHFDIQKKTFSDNVNAKGMDWTGNSSTEQSIQQMEEKQKLPEQMADLTPQNVGVLPEVFTPVVDKPSHKGHAFAFLIITIFVFLMMAGGAYVWMNRQFVLTAYPELKSIFTFETLQTAEQYVAKEKAQMKGEIVSDEIVPDELIIAPVIEDQNVALSPVTIDTETIEAKPMKKQTTKDRILPVEVTEEHNEMQNKNDHVDELSAVASFEQKRKIDLMEDVVLEDIPLPIDVTDQKTTEVVEKEVLKTEQPNKIIDIRDVSFKYDQSDTAAPRLFVQGVVSNLTQTPVAMPPLQVQLFDANDVLLGVRELPYAIAVLKPMASEFFFYELTEVPEAIVTRVMVKVKGK